MTNPVSIISLATGGFSIDNHTFTVEGNSQWITQSNLEKLITGFAAAEKYLTLLSQGRTKESSLSIKLVSQTQIYQTHGYGTRAYYDQYENCLYLPGDQLISNTVEHELNHAIDDFLYVDPDDPFENDIAFASSRSDHPIQAPVNQDGCQIQGIDQYRTLMEQRINRKTPQFDSKLNEQIYQFEEKIRNNGIENPYYCYDPQESIAVSRYYTNDSNLFVFRVTLDQAVKAHHWEQVTTLLQEAGQKFDSPSIDSLAGQLFKKSANGEDIPNSVWLQLAAVSQSQDTFGQAASKLANANRSFDLPLEIRNLFLIPSPRFQKFILRSLYDPINAKPDPYAWRDINFWLSSDSSTPAGGTQEPPTDILEMVLSYALQMEVPIPKEAIILMVKFGSTELALQAFKKLTYMENVDQEISEILDDMNHDTKNPDRVNQCAKLCIKKGQASPLVLAAIVRNSSEEEDQLFAFRKILEERDTDTEIAQVLSFARNHFDIKLYMQLLMLNALKEKDWETAGVLIREAKKLKFDDDPFINRLHRDQFIDKLTRDAFTAVTREDPRPEKFLKQLMRTL